MICFFRIMPSEKLDYLELQLPTELCKIVLSFYVYEDDTIFVVQLTNSIRSTQPFLCVIKKSLWTSNGLTYEMWKIHKTTTFNHDVPSSHKDFEKQTAFQPLIFTGFLMFVNDIEYSSTTLNLILNKQIIDKQIIDKQTIDNQTLLWSYVFYPNTNITSANTLFYDNSRERRIVTTNNWSFDNFNLQNINQDPGKTFTLLRKTLV